MILFIYFLTAGRVATRFSAEGSADGWVNRLGFLVFFVTLLSVTDALLFYLYHSMHRLWPDYINLPNMQFWVLGPEKQRQGKEIVRDVIALIGCFTGVVYLLALLPIYLVNLHDPDFKLSPNLVFPTILVLMGALLFLLYWFTRPTSRD